MSSSHSLIGTHVTVGMMTSGGLAPCLSSSIAHLTKHWVEALQTQKISGLTIRLYRAGYKGLLTGDSVLLEEKEWKTIDFWNAVGGSPIENSRVKLTNVDDCIAKGYIKQGDTPLEVASQQLLKDDIDVLHTIGGDDTNTQAAKLSHYLMEKHGGRVLVIGMPKTIDNDVYPIYLTLGAQTAAQQGALFFANVVNESTANPRSLILHECMGRDSGSLTAETARAYRENYLLRAPVLSIMPYGHARDIDAIWIPELPLDLDKEAERLKKIMDDKGSVHIFFGEGTGVEEIVAQMEKRGEEVPRDAFGHVKIAKIRPGEFFAKHVADALGAEKTLVQRSGYFCRSAAANAADQALIAECAKVGVESALKGISGCMGQDEDKPDKPMRAIEFERIKGGKPFDVKQEWFQQLLKDIGQISE